LDLGANDFTVGLDYRNAGFGSGDGLNSLGETSLGSQVIDLDGQLVDENIGLSVQVNEYADPTYRKSFGDGILLAKQTAILARQGNINAQNIVDQLRNQGISINPDGNQEKNR